MNLAADPSSVSPTTVARFECPTNIATEAGSETVNIDFDGGELDSEFSITLKGLCHESVLSLSNKRRLRRIYDNEHTPLG